LGDFISVDGAAPIRKSDLIGVGEVCRILGVCPTTARTMDREGILTAYRYKNGYRKWSRKEVVAYVTGEELADENRMCFIYCRVSTSRQSQLKEDKQGANSSDLHRQIARMKTEAQNRYPGLQHVVLAETGSGMNYERRILNRWLDGVLAGKYNNSVLICENRERLVRFAAPLIEKILASKNIDIIYTAQEDNTAEADFASDVCACIHYFSTKLYSGRANARNRAYLSDDVIREAKQRIELGIALKTVAEQLNTEGYRTEGGALLTYNILNKYVYQQMKKLSKTIPSVESSAQRYKREFIEETNGDTVLPIHRVYEHYLNWAERNKLVVVSKRLFGIEFPYAHQAYIRTEGRQWRSWRGFKVKGEALHEHSPEKEVLEETPKELLLRFARSIAPYKGSQLAFVKKYRAFCEQENRMPLARPTVIRTLIEIGWWNIQKGKRNHDYLEVTKG